MTLTNNDSPIYSPRSPPLTNHFFFSLIAFTLSLSFYCRIEVPLSQVKKRSFREKNKMFINTSSIPCNPLSSSFRHPRLSKRHNLRVRRLNRRRRVLKEEAKKNKRVRVVKMEMKNLKLFMVNRSIIEENEKLRQKALLLHQENQALLFQLQTKLSQQQKQQHNH